MKSLRVGIVGAGIVGLAHAWSAARRGHQVEVFEKSPRASGASIRNFGMVWPIGQPRGAAFSVAMRSRQAWLELGQQAGVWVNRCGSIHLAYRDDELAVLREFAQAAPDHGIDCRLISADETRRRSTAANPKGLLGGLLSESELCVNPRDASAQIAAWLQRRWGVVFRFGTAVSAIHSEQVHLADGPPSRFDRVIVCGGAEVENLFPEVVRRSGIRLCKLQMLATDPQPGGWRLGPHLAGGLTLRHYASFETCPSLVGLRQRIATETPELDHFGIHVMASQTDDGRVILGDSHEYDEAIDPFDKAEIDRLILRELRKLIALPSWSIDQRWHGVYAKLPSRPILKAEPLPEVHVRTGTGGAGMTLSFGLAESDWDDWDERFG